MVDALPYLVEYSHGCTEQTVNRSRPTVITMRTLQRVKVDLADVRKKRGGDPRQVQRAAGEGVGDVRAGAEGQQRRDRAVRAGLTTRAA
jgi:hypothetical protein